MPYTYAIMRFTSKKTFRIPGGIQQAEQNKYTKIKKLVIFETTGQNILGKHAQG